MPPRAPGFDYDAHVDETLRRDRKVLVLDLDETLVHTTPPDMQKPIENTYSVTRPPTADGEIRHLVTFNVYERPFVGEFLSTVSEWFRVVIMTASLRAYSDPIIDRLERHCRFEARYYRDSCTPLSFFYVKDLERICADFEVDLSQVIIVDNAPVSYAKQPENALPISNWTASDPHDDELLGILGVLEGLRFCGDVRSVLVQKMKS